MEDTSENKAIKQKKHINVGILAHVDAGKTTLAEAILYKTGSIRKAGRVDHGDAFLDTFELERARGITIFSKQAQLQLGERPVTLLDTPGHVDFSAEMERTLQVLDYAVLVISGADGVQGHVLTLWRLLRQYEIPVFLFINKMDQEGTSREKLIKELQNRLDERCLDFGADRLTMAAEEAGQLSRRNLRTKDGEALPENPGMNKESLPESSGMNKESLPESSGMNKESLPESLGMNKESFSENLDMEEEAFLENLAMSEEAVLERYLEDGTVELQDRIRLIRERKVFPCYFGSALKMTGIEAFLKGLELYMQPREYPREFGARIYKIARDAQGSRITYLKVTGGVLRVKQQLEGNWINAEGQQEIWKEKADQLRIYSGAGFQTVAEAGAGMICGVTGLTHTFCGQGLGWENKTVLPVLEPVLTYQLSLPPECDVHVMFGRLQQLEEEIPELHLVWKEESQEIHAQVMGEVQIEILKSMIRERYGILAEFGSGSIVYKETIASCVEGVGHFEPLRHYAEVHLLLEPGEPGSGLSFSSACSTDVLDLNWQRLILTHLEEKQHRGVLTGSEITDMRITLVSGRAHLKHTEGGDFRQATYRAVRQGLRKAESILLEPVYEFRLELPSENVGRAMADIQKMQGSFEPPVLEGDTAVLCGTAPAARMRDYQREVSAYTRGCGRLSCTLKGYEPCQDAPAVIEAIGYDSERDLENPTGSVFCAHGAGFVVPWDQVEDYMHLEYSTQTEQERLEEERRNTQPQQAAAGRGFRADIQDDKELQEIFRRTFGSVKQERTGWNRKGGRSAAASGSSVRSYGAGAGKIGENAYSRSSLQGGEESAHRNGKSLRPEDSYLLVDGYNIIFAWEDLKELAAVNMDAARGRLMDILCNYQGYRNMNLILVFDAYKVEGGVGEVQKYHNIYVIYTKEAETADQYIEKAVHRMGRKYDVTVATSDAAEQIIIWGQGARRLSAQGLRTEIQDTCREIQKDYLKKNPGGKNYLFENLSEDMAALMEEVRLGKRTL